MDQPSNKPYLAKTNLVEHFFHLDIWTHHELKKIAIKLIIYFDLFNDYRLY